MAYIEPKPVSINAGNGGFGGAYTNYEVDSLEEPLFTWLKGQQAPTALDLGCGHGGVARRMADAGAIVTAWDNQRSCITATRKHFAETNQAATYVCGSMADPKLWKRHIQPASLHVALLFRSLNWLPYQQAQAVIRQLHRALVPGGKVWFIILGSHAPIVPRHHIDHPLPQRFLKIEDQGIIEALNFYEPITAYAPSEVTKLFEGNGLQIGHCRTGEYHHKGWAEKL